MIGSISRRSPRSVPLASIARWAAAFLLALTTPGFGEEPNALMLTALRPFHGFVGTWKGDGTSLKSSGWTETAEVTWGFRDKDGRVSINFHVEGNPHLEVGLLTYDLSAKKYVFIGKDTGGTVRRFDGEPSGSQTLRLIRSDADAKDGLDRLEIKLVRAGDKLIYNFARKKGRTLFEPLAEMQWFREGAPLESFQKGPRCVVTGGAGRLAVEYKGRTYHAACPACKEEFLLRPDKYIANLPAGDP